MIDRCTQQIAWKQHHQLTHAWSVTDNTKAQCIQHCFTVVKTQPETDKETAKQPRPDLDVIRPFSAEMWGPRISFLFVKKYISSVVTFRLCNRATKENGAQLPNKLWPVGPPFCGPPVQPNTLNKPKPASINSCCITDQVTLLLFLLLYLVLAISLHSQVPGNCQHRSTVRCSLHLSTTRRNVSRPCKKLTCYAAVRPPSHRSTVRCSLNLSTIRQDVATPCADIPCGRPVTHAYLHAALCPCAVGQVASGRANKQARGARDMRHFLKVFDVQ